MKAPSSPMLLLLPLVVVIAIGSAILLYDRFVVRRHQEVSDHDAAAQRLAADLAFSEVAEEQSMVVARRLLGDLEPLVQIQGTRVAAMLQREGRAGTVWALDLEHPATTRLLRPGPGSSTMDLEHTVLQTIIVVEADDVSASEAMPLWFGFRGGGGAGPWAELLEESALRSKGLVPTQGHALAESNAAERVAREDARDPADGSAGSDGVASGSFVAVSRAPQRVAQRLSLSPGMVERMTSWPDVLFIGVDHRLVIVWPEARASLAYWASRSTSAELVPSIAAPGFEWDLQRAVDLANGLHLAGEQSFERVVNLDIPRPQIELPELDLTSGFEAAREELERRTEELLGEFDRDRERIRRESEERRAEIRREFEDRLTASQQPGRAIPGTEAQKKTDGALEPPR